MAQHTPSFVRAAVADPKAASDSALLAVLDYHNGEFDAEALDLVAEEVYRRGGDPEYLDRLSPYEAWL